MAKQLDSLSLLDILPGSISGDFNVQALARALDPELQAVAKDISNVLIYSRIDSLPESVIDLLAWQWHVDFYDPSLPLEVKRNLVRASIPWHHIKGTPAAVERMVTTVFGHSSITEWFEHEPKRQPYTFRLSVDLDDRTPDMTAASLANLRRVVECAKNTRSFLELIELFFHLEDKTEVEDELSILSPLLSYEDAYPYPARIPPGEHDGRFLHGGAVYRDGRFLHDGAADHSGLVPGWRVRGGSTVRIDDLYLAYHTSFYDDVSEWSFTPEHGAAVFRDGVFARNEALRRDGLKGNPFSRGGLLSRCGMIARRTGAYFYDGAISRGEFSRNRLTLPADWFLMPLIKYAPEDSAEPADNNGIMDICCDVRYVGGVRRDARAARGVERYSGPLDGALSVRRGARNGNYARSGDAERRHDALATAA